MRVLDLYCGVGGSAVGYHRAGFTEVVGVDHVFQPRYPFAFVQADALEYVQAHGHEFDAIHASPPCQAYSVVSAIRPDYKYPDLIKDTRNALQSMGKPYVIENVPGAPLLGTLMLCGSMFGLQVKRHRIFETSFGLFSPPYSCNHQKGQFLDMYSSGHRRRGTERSYCDAMGVTWAPVSAATESIPPAYCDFIGRELLKAIERGEERRSHDNDTETREATE